MYKEFIIILIVFFVIYFLYLNDSRIEWEAYNGVKYKIKDENNKNLNQQKTDLLAKIDTKARTIVKNMHENNLPSKQIANRTYDRFKNSKIGETPHGDNSAAYTLNKGDIYICCLTNGKLNDENDAFFVILHELAHVMSNSYGHGDEFKTNFNFIVKLAVKLKLWTPAKYEEKPVNYCGVNVTTDPCDGDTCNSNNLDYYFKESLMDYK